MCAEKLMRTEESVVISVVVLCYNHSRYIESTLDGIVCQKTEFPYEVLIHDDASTDDSQSIISRYVENHPGTFRLIFQKSNQYSKEKKSGSITFYLIVGENTLRFAKAMITGPIHANFQFNIDI